MGKLRKGRDDRQAGERKRKGTQVRLRKEKAQNLEKGRKDKGKVRTTENKGGSQKFMRDAKNNKIKRKCLKGREKIRR